MGFDLWNKNLIIVDLFYLFLWLCYFLYINIFLIILFNLRFKFEEVKDGGEGWILFLNNFEVCGVRKL